MSNDDIPDGVLSPDELEPDDDRLRQLDERRYVVSTDADPEDDPEARPAPDVDVDGVHGDRPPADAGSERDGLALDELDGAYALAVRARTDGAAIEDCRIDTDDVSVAFESLLRWYADQVAEDTPPEEVLAVLLQHTDIQLPTMD
jgi:hypothetical protein